MNPILQPVDDLLNQKDQAILLLQKAADLTRSTSVFPDLECSPWLVAPGTAANTPGSGATMIPSQAIPSTNSAWLGITPQDPWANAYFYKRLGADASKNTFTFELFALFADMFSSQASNCVELDIQQVITGLGFNPGFQFDFGGNRLRVWDRNSKQWIATGQPCQRWTPGQWNHIVFEAHRDNTTIYHDALTLNGARIVLGQSFPAPHLSLPDMLNCAIQLDGNKAAQPHKLYLDRVKFTAR